MYIKLNLDCSKDKHLLNLKKEKNSFAIAVGLKGISAGAGVTIFICLAVVLFFNIKYILVGYTLYIGIVSLVTGNIMLQNELEYRKALKR